MVRAQGQGVHLRRIGKHKTDGCMNLRSFIPSPAEIGREAVILICGALLAALIMRQWPAGKTFIRDAWGEPGGHT